MTDESKIVSRIRAALVTEPRIGVKSHPIGLSWSEGTLTMAGEVESVAAKKLALERAAAVVGVETIVDRLRVAPAKPMEDGAIRNALRDAFFQEPAFAECALRALAKGATEVIRDVPGVTRGSIEYEIGDGIVTLNGELPSLEHKRLAGVLAWWIPGSRDVVNGIAVEPPEDDSDAQITDAVRHALEKDPFVDASQVRVLTRDSVVVLEGLVRSEGERDLAESDAWYVFGVSGVVNSLAASAPTA